MSKPSSASRHVMLLILITGLFVAVWSTDSGHAERPEMRPVSHSRSAIAILMQATAVEPPSEGVFDAGFGDETEIACRTLVAHSRLAAAAWIATTICGAGEFEFPVILDEPVEAPLPGPVESPSILIEPPIDAPIPAVVAFDNPVEAPIPIVDAGPVIAPIPPTIEPPLVERKERLPVLSSVARRVKLNYRMTCHCCREYCGIAARKVAAFQRRSRQACSDMVETVSQAVNGSDWKTRLSSEPAEGSKRRF